MSANVREASSLEVRKRLIVLLDSGADLEVQVRLDRELLVQGAREVVAEAACTSDPRLLGTDSHRSTDGGDIWAGWRELGSELRGLLSIVALARGAHPIVAGRFEHGDSPETHQSDEVADLYSILPGNSLLIISI